jgi:hypothetical protein
MTINAVPGDPLANAYCTVEQATVFLQERLSVEAWYSADPEAAITLPHRREAALMQATRLLDEQVGWYGVPTSPDQALALPQTGLVDQWGRTVASDVIPRAVQQATAFYALTLLENVTGTSAAATGDLLIKSQKIGDMTITYQDVSSTSASVPASPDAMPAEVKALLRPYGLVAGMGILRLVRT